MQSKLDSNPEDFLMSMDEMMCEDSGHYARHTVGALVNIYYY